MHGFDLSRVLALAGRTQTPEVWSWHRAEQMNWSLELSRRWQRRYYLLREVAKEL